MSQLVQTTLWEHQRQTIERFEYEPRVLNGWDMGTGKTLAAIERDLRLRIADSTCRLTLVVAPLGTHDQWAEFWALEAPGLTVRVIDRKDRNAFLRDTKADVYIMHWEAIRLMLGLRNVFHHGIFDEVHYIKNRNSAVTKASKKLKIPYLTDMSGSPATDRPSDIWSILNHLKPRTWSSYWRFVDQMVENEPIYKAGQDTGHKKMLGPTKLWLDEGLPSIHPYYSRVEIEDVIDMPDKLYNKVYVDLAPIQRRAYDEMDKEFIAWVSNLAGELTPMVAPALIAKLQRLQQFALAMMTYDETVGSYKMSMPSPKLEAVMDLLEAADNTTFLIWSQFKAPLYLLSQLMNKRAKTKGGPVSHVLYTGDQNDVDRKEGKRRFMAGEAQCFLATIRAAGTGTDGLQNNCQHMIFLDRDWSPMRNQQAESRLWRGGQHKPVVITDIMARNTVDFPRGITIQMKKEWVMQTLGGKYQ